MPKRKGIVHAELSVAPIGSGSTSLGKYVAKAINAIKQVKGIRYQVTPMGTLLESDNVDRIFEAVKAADNALFRMGVKRVETILKVDERRDKIKSMEEKLKSIEQYT